MTLKHLLLSSLAVTTAFLGTGCSTVNKLLDNDAGIDYKSSKVATKLEVPPDLTQLKTNDRFVQRGAVSGGGGHAEIETLCRDVVGHLGRDRLCADQPVGGEEMAAGFEDAVHFASSASGKISEI